LLLRSNLRLLLSQLDELAETPYFSPELDEYLNQLRSVLDKLLSKLSDTPPTINFDVGQLIGHHVWELTQFLTGSTTKRIPYEVVFAIEKAAGEWTSRKLLITTAILQEANFYFIGGRKDFFNTVETELGIVISSQPIQIALPHIYRHKPLFCIPLFHELGHFVDTSNEVVTTSMLTEPEDSGPDLPDLPTSAEIAKKSGPDRTFFKEVVQQHRREYFADLFCGAYTGKAARGFLEEFCPNNSVSPTHPSSAARYAVIEAFLSATPNPIVDLLQRALAARGLPALTKRCATIHLDATFDEVRPYKLTSNEEVFGLFDAGWSYLKKTWTNPSNLWRNLSEDVVERVANDLTEKSIRNRMIVEGWNASANPP
jgi:hypothetical protein